MGLEQKSLSCIATIILTFSMSHASDEMNLNTIVPVLVGSQPITAKAWKKLADSPSFKGDLVDCLERFAEIEEPEPFLNKSFANLKDMNLLEDGWLRNYLNCVLLRSEAIELLRQHKDRKSTSLASIHRFSAQVAELLESVRSKSWAVPNLGKLPDHLARHQMHPSVDSHNSETQQKLAKLPLLTNRGLMELRMVLYEFGKRLGFSELLPNPSPVNGAMQILQHDSTFADKNSLWISMQSSLQEKAKVRHDR